MNNNIMELNKFPGSTPVFSTYTKDNFIKVQAKILRMLDQTVKTFSFLKDIKETKITKKLNNISRQANSPLHILNPELAELANNIFATAQSLPLSSESIKLKTNFLNLAIEVLLMGMETDESQTLYITIHYNYLFIYLGLGLTLEPEIFTYSEKIFEIKLTQSKALMTDFDLALKVLNILITKLNILLMNLSKKPTESSELIGLINQYALKKLLKLLAQLEAIISIPFEKYFLLNINLLRIIKFNFVNKYTNEDIEELISFMHTTWLNKIKLVAFSDSNASFIYSELNNDIFHIIQNFPDYFADHKLSLSHLEEMKEYYHCVERGDEKVIVKELDDQKIYHSKKDNLSERERLIFFTPKFKEDLEKSVVAASEFLQGKEYEFKKLPSYSIHIGGPLIISNDIFLTALKINYLISITELTLLREIIAVVKNLDKNMLKNIDTHVGLICSYLAGIIRQLSELELNNEKLFKAESEIVNAGIALSQILSKDNIDFTRYQTEFFSYQLIILLNSGYNNFDELKPLIKKIYLIKCLEFESYSSQIELISRICEIFIRKINTSTDNQIILLSFITDFSQKLIDAFNEIKGKELSESQYIQVFLLTMNKLIYIADFYFRQYTYSNKTNKQLLLNNGQSLAKKVIRYILIPLKSMDLTNNDRRMILNTIYGIANNHRELFKVEEGKVLTNLLKKYSYFVISTPCNDEQLVKSICLLQNLAESIPAQTLKPASSTLEKIEQKNELSTSSKKKKKKKSKKNKNLSKNTKNANISLIVQSEAPATQPCEVETKIENKTIVTDENQKTEIEKIKKNFLEIKDCLAIVREKYQKSKEKIAKMQELETHYMQEIISLKSKLKDFDSREKKFQEEKNHSQRIIEKERKLYKMQEKLLQGEKEKTLKMENQDRQKLFDIQNRLEEVIKLNKTNKTKVEELQKTEMNYKQQISTLEFELSSQVDDIQAEKSSLIKELKDEKNLNITYEQMLKVEKEKNFRLEQKLTEIAKKQKLREEELQNELKLEKSRTEALTRHSQNDMKDLSTLYFINQTKNAKLFEEMDQEIRDLRYQLFLQEQAFQEKSFALIQSSAHERQAIAKTIINLSSTNTSKNKSWKPNLSFHNEGGHPSILQKSILELTS